MRFKTLNETIPYAVDGKKHALSMQPYNAIKLMMPGRHAKDTVPVGGDFVVCVTDENMGWIEHQFTHATIFQDLEAKNLENHPRAEEFMEFYLKVVKGHDPDKVDEQTEVCFDSLQDTACHPKTMVYALQCLAVAEHRRYAHYEHLFGGRYLPFRFAAGIVEDRWTAADAIAKASRGRIGIEWLEKDHGRPLLTKELMGK